MLVLAHGGRIVGCNEAAEVVLGRTRNQLIGSIPIFGRTEPLSATEASETENPGGAAGF